MHTALGVRPGPAHVAVHGAVVALVARLAGGSMAGCNVTVHRSQVADRE